MIIIICDIISRLLRLLFTKLESLKNLKTDSDS